jgi:transcriptional/translational regulatory protein YebC/TACO1
MPKKQKSYKLLFLIKELFMAGHSKWANIKHRKARQDASKGKVFTKYLREIVVAAQMGGGNEADNPRLRAIVSKALSANMTRDVINRAIQRGMAKKYKKSPTKVMAWVAWRY